MIVVTSLLAVAAASCVLTWLFRRLLVKLAMLDIPNERSSHRLPVPRGGGVAIVFTVVATWLLAAIYGLVDRQEVAVMAAGGMLVAAVGLADDRSDVPAQWRLAVHLISAALLVAAANGLNTISLGGISVDLGWAGSVLAVLYIVWLLNLYNFMDGIDGIAGVEAVTVALPAAVLLWITGDTAMAVVTATIGAASLGFLVWNWAPAKIFMGDVGSSFLGYTFGALAVLDHETTSVDIYAWSILLGVFIVDATVTLIRRIVTGQRFYKAHRSHAYQHATDRYGAHGKVTAAVGVLNVVWLFPMAALVVTGRIDGFYGLVIAYIPLLGLAAKYHAGKRAE
jgi:Fuc2NAc and GlcNAc transferase